MVRSVSCATRTPPTKAIGMTMIAASGTAHSWVAGVPKSQSQATSGAQQLPSLLEVQPAPVERHRHEFQREEPRGHQRQQDRYHGLSDHRDESRDQHGDGEQQRSQYQQHAVAKAPAQQPPPGQLGLGGCAAELVLHLLGDVFVEGSTDGQRERGKADQADDQRRTEQCDTGGTADRRSPARRPVLGERSDQCRQVIEPVDQGDHPGEQEQHGQDRGEHTDQ